MKGKTIGMGLVGTALVAGAALYYLQVYYFYDEVAAADVTIRLTSLVSGAPEAIPVAGLQAIDAGSSPIRFRACFDTPLDQALLGETFAAYDGAEPLIAPGWFDCFDASDIGVALEGGQARAFLSETGIALGVDRVVAIFENGRGYAWNQIQPGFGE
jgi:hypothetical protein